jgi:hypothetical protein
VPSGELTGGKEAAASDMAEVVKAFGVQVLWTHGLQAALAAALADGANLPGRAEGALYGVAALMRRCKVNRLCDRFVCLFGRCWSFTNTTQFWFDSPTI